MGKKREEKKRERERKVAFRAENTSSKSFIYWSRGMTGGKKGETNLYQVHVRGK